MIRTKQKRLKDILNVFERRSVVKLYVALPYDFNLVSLSVLNLHVRFFDGCFKISE